MLESKTADRAADDRKDESDPVDHRLNVGHALIGKHCVVRTYSAGVHIGTVVAKDGTHVLLSDARRLWTWDGAFTLSEVATLGVSKAGSRIACAVPLIELTQAVEIIPTSEAARAKFDAIHE